MYFFKTAFKSKRRFTKGPLEELGEISGKPGDIPSEKPDEYPPPPWPLYPRYGVLDPVKSALFSHCFNYRVSAYLMKLAIFMQDQILETIPWLIRFTRILVVVFMGHGIKIFPYLGHRQPKLIMWERYVDEAQSGWKCNEYSWLQPGKCKKA